MRGCAACASTKGVDGLTSEPDGKILAALRSFYRRFRRLCDAVAFVPLLLVFAVLAPVSRLFRRRVDVGLGPEPLISHVFHKRSLLRAGFTAETYVSHLYFITRDFDVVCTWPACSLASLWLGARALFRYRALYFSFNGGPLAWTPLRRVEPFIYRLAGVKTVILPYGSDCQIPSRCGNLPYRHALNADYPGWTGKAERRVSANVARWSEYADHIISGCDWVYYTPRWDTLCLAHFSIDTEEFAPPEASGEGEGGAVTILHAPNHRTIKGSEYFVKAVDELRAEGYAVELRLVGGMPNAELRELIRKADIIADQLVIGWYGMFALEGMAAGKPVLCFIREDLRELYEFAGLLRSGELPLVDCDFGTVKGVLRGLLGDREGLRRIGWDSREFVVRRHSLAVVGGMFGEVNRGIGVLPSGVERR